MAKKVAVFGGGVAGLTAAHELACRGYQVTVYERRDRLGGKARTQYWDPGWGQGLLPGEHGFRFFPAFYHCIDDTLGRIPLNGSGRSVSPADGLGTQPGSTVLSHNMIDPTYQAWGQPGRPVAQFPRRPPQNDDLWTLLKFFFTQDLGVSLPDLARIWWKMARFVGSCDRRRLGEYEQMTYWQFMGADNLSAAAQRLLVHLPRCLVAMDARRANARTLANVSFLLMIGSLEGAQKPDRILRGPTTEMWIEPWRRWLDALGVTLRSGPGQALRRLDVANREITGATLAGGEVVHADYYVLAVPLEEAVSLMTPALRAASHDLDTLASIDPNVALSWMTGVQLYLKKDEPVLDGHVAYIDSDWAVTSVSQAQFWAPENFKQRYGLGRVDGVMSADVSDWFTNGQVHGKPASQCTRAEIQDELVAQMGSVLTAQGHPVLPAANVEAMHVDDDIQFDAAGVVSQNLSRLLIHPPGLWAKRPRPHDAAGVANLFLAADYVRNDMDLATMEGANQAARDSVNALLEQDGSGAPRCLSVNHLELNEPAWVKTLKALDEAAWDLGHPYDELVSEEHVERLGRSQSHEELENECRRLELEAPVNARRSGRARRPGPAPERPPGP